MVCQIRINTKLLSTLYGAFRPIIFEYNSLSLSCSFWSFVKSVIFCWVHSISDLYQYKALVNCIWGLWPYYFLNITHYHCCAFFGPSSSNLSFVDQVLLLLYQYKTLVIFHRVFGPHYLLDITPDICLCSV